MGRKLIIESGNKYGMLTVIRQLPGSRSLCRCECGSETVKKTGNLRSGNTRSCGCVTSVWLSRPTHGLSKTSEYRIWGLMLHRCRNPRDARYKSYGGRGITVCERWWKFENFIADMGPRPSLSHSLDRYPDNDGPYSPENCRWATPEQQARNKGNSTSLTVGGRTATIAE